MALLALVPAAAPAQDPKRINEAVQAGVAALKQHQAADGSWAQGTTVQHRTGATALAALALLECDVDVDDPAIARATGVVRAAAAREGQTYDIALALMFFDRLGRAEDEALIQSLTTRLLKGQNKFGGWSYDCPVEVSTVADGAQAPGPVSLAAPGALGLGPNDDNSNTQFATLALWVARRHKLAADAALEAVGQRFHGSQNTDGGWSYHLYPGAYQQRSTATMTCAGLLGVAVSYGVAREAVLRTRLSKPEEEKNQAPRMRDPNRDPAVRLGLTALGELLRAPNALLTYGGALAFRRGGPGPGRGGPPLGRGGPADPASGAGAVASNLNFYLLWSVERVAMAFGLRTIGRLDWYAWGAPALLAGQNADGSWAGSYGPAVDTSFALLFLRRSNLVKDLSNDLRDLIHDPSEVRLKSGGVGGRGLKGQETSLNPSAVGKADRPPKKTRPSSIPELRPDDADAGSGPRPDGKGGDDRLDPETAQLSAAVVRAAGAEQEALIDRLRDARGVVNTQALAAAIPHLGGPARTRARDALAERLTRMTSATLRDKFRDEDLEIRRAAALAAAMKNETAFVPDLIELLADPEPPVTRAVHAALKALTREDFGPTADASRAERTEAISKWKAWWANQKK
jgi:hypothetical protein